MVTSPKTADLLSDLSETSTCLLAMPHYVLLHENVKLGPEPLALREGTVPVVVYGFTDKEQYQRFQQRTSLELTPYPLVHFYLKDQLELGGPAWRLVAVNPEGPADPKIPAISMMELLNGMLAKKERVFAGYELILNPTSHSYECREVETAGSSFVEGAS